MVDRAESQEFGHNCRYVVTAKLQTADFRTTPTLPQGSTLPPGHIASFGGGAVRVGCITQGQIDIGIRIRVTATLTRVPSPENVKVEFRVGVTLGGVPHPYWFLVYMVL